MHPYVKYRKISGISIVIAFLCFVPVPFFSETPIAGYSFLGFFAFLMLGIYFLDKSMKFNKKEQKAFEEKIKTETKFKLGQLKWLGITIGILILVAILKYLAKIF